jgi:hypothetical protein
MIELEKEIELKCCRYAESKGIAYSKTSSPGRRGFVDRVFWVPGGSPLLIEFKRADGVVSAQQAATIRRLNNLSYRVHVCYSVAQFKEILDGVLK